jgi:capsular polysaccharide biosynthesis protein
MSVSFEGPRSVRNLSWCLRHFGWVALVCVLVGAAAPLLVMPTDEVYQAETVVVARQLTANARVLPSLAEAVFADGAVAAAVAKDPAVADDTAGLVPDKVSVVAGPDSITMVVQVRDPDPATAARLADLAGNAFAAELNRGGAGVGTFGVQAPAIIPTAPLDVLAEPVRAGLGALAGLVLGLGLVALIAALRRPTVTSRDVEAAVGVPLLGTVELPRAAPGVYLGARGVRGIATVTRWLATAPPGRLTLISSPAAEGMRHRIFVMAAIAMSTVRSVRLKAQREVLDAVRRQAPRDTDATPSPSGHTDIGELSFVDGGSPFEIVDPAGSPAHVVAVAPLGISQRRLRALALDYLSGGLVGVILVQRRLGFGRTRTVASSPARAPRALRPADDLREPA